MRSFRGQGESKLLVSVSVGFLRFSFGSVRLVWTVKLTRAGCTMVTCW